MQPCFVVQSDQDTDAPVQDAVATISKEDAWDHGAAAIGAAVATAGGLWIDRPYWTGNPTTQWLVDRVIAAATAGAAVVQLGNEQNLPAEGFVGGPEDWFALEDAVRAGLGTPEILLAMPPSPGVPGWESWVRDVGPDGLVHHHAVHCYGTYWQMREVVEWYLEHTAGDLYITECNFGAGQSADRDAWAHEDLEIFLDWCALEERIRACAYFAWVWHGAPELPTPVDAKGTEIEAVVRDWRPPMNGGEEVGVLEGIDVSNWQRIVSWDAVAGHERQFAFVKSSEDPDYRDPYFAANWRGMAEAGLARGIYHFARPSRVTPDRSVALLAEQIAAVGGLKPGDMLALDLEDTDVAPTASLVDWTVEWLERALEHFGVRPFVYSGTWYLEPHGLDDPKLAAWPLWLASYQTLPPPAPEPWDRVDVWQYSSRGTVDGVGGDCDCNRFVGTPEELRALGYAGAVAPDEVQALRDRTWALADALQVVAADWTTAGWPSTGSGIGSAAEAIKSLVRSSQGQQ